MLRGEIRVKLFIKRNTTDEEIAFYVYDDNENIKYAVSVQAEPSLRMMIQTLGGEPLAAIKYNTFVLNYFTVRCANRFYALIPCLNERFSFSIYGSTYRFMGSLLDGEFSMFSSDGETVMTQKKCWTTHGDGYELNISDEPHELFLISAALCADVFLTLGETKAILST